MFSVGLVAEKRKSVYSQCCMMMTAARVTDAPHRERAARAVNTARARCVLVKQ